MNKLITKIAGATLGVAMAIGVGVAIGTRPNDVRATYAAAGDEVVGYTLDGSTAGTGNAYASNNSATVGGITWTVQGNATTSPWRLGGKLSSATDRAVYSTETLEDATTEDISKVVVSLGTKQTQITVNSVTIKVGTSENGSEVSSETITSNVNSSNAVITFNRPSEKSWANRYFSFVLNLSSSSSNSNYYVQFSKAEFYYIEPASTDPEDASLDSLIAISDPTKLSYYSDSTNSDIDYTGASLQAHYTSESDETWSKDVTLANDSLDWSINMASLKLTATYTDENDDTASYQWTVSDAGQRPMSGSMTTFETISGYITGTSNRIRYEAAQGNAGTAPAVNGGEIRIYQNGGTLTVSAITGYRLTSVTIGSSMATTVTYKVDSMDTSSDQSISKNGDFELDDISALSVLFTCTGTTTSSRLYLNKLEVTYAVDETPSLTLECGTETTLVLKQGAKQYGVSHLNIDDDATFTFTYSVSGVATASISNWILTLTPVATGTTSVDIKLGDDVLATVSVSVDDITGYVKADSLDNLYEGAKVIIVGVFNNSTYYVATDSLNSSGSVQYITHDTGTYSNPYITDIGDGAEYTVRFFGGRIALETSEGTYLASTVNKYVAFSETLNAGVTWEFDGSSLLAGSEIGYLRLNYNSGSPRFTTYTGNASASIVNVNLYVSTDSVKTSALGADTFAYRYLHMRDYTVGDGSCMNNSTNHYYSTAKTAYASLTEQEKTAFASLTDAVARLSAWAEANGETFDPSAKVFSAAARIGSIANIAESTNTTVIIVIASLVTLTAVGGLFIIRKRKEHE